MAPTEATRAGYTADDIVGGGLESAGSPSGGAPCVIATRRPGPRRPVILQDRAARARSNCHVRFGSRLLYAVRNQRPVPTVTVPLQHAVAEFRSERLYQLNGDPAPNLWGPIGGLHPTRDGYVRIHDGFPNHRDGILRVLGLPQDGSVTRADVSGATRAWSKVDLETAALENGACAYALRSYEEWDALPQAQAIGPFPISIRKISDGGMVPRSGAATTLPGDGDKCLRGLRVLELSRVLAAPVAGRTLAAHGADVLWVTSPELPALPALDLDTSRGKRTVQLDLDSEEGKETLLELATTCDVFIQGYGPGSLAGSRSTTGGIVVGNLSAFGPEGPWARRRGFDSLVQTCSGMNVLEAEHYGAGEPARSTPCQALDHAAGYFLAAGVCAALHRKAADGGTGSYVVDVSLAGVMKYLRSLGLYEGRLGFEDGPDLQTAVGMDTELFETRRTGFGELRGVRHSAAVDRCAPGWDEMPKPLGSDIPAWLPRRGD
ncbi:hypothetical protein PG997_010854 [Apiospora hydei]|uniref:CoA-transferase family III n=1 Tax=Apiospora hydei TaxID=1337664 RepID=A0ABR1VHE0_9PEZI